MALSTKTAIVAAITARQAAFPSGVFVDGVERPGTVSRDGIIDEVFTLCDAILALVTGSSPIPTTRDGLRAAIAAHRKGTDQSVVTASGIQQPGRSKSRNPAFNYDLATLVQSVADLVDDAFGATAAADAAIELVANTQAQRGSSVALYGAEGTELPGITSIHEFRPLYLAVLALVAAALP